MINTQQGLAAERGITSGFGREVSYWPAWVGMIGAPVWIVDPQGKISYINERAEALLGRSASECLGQSCYEVIAGTDFSGCRLCTTPCPISSLVKLRREIEPMKLWLMGSDGRRRCTQVLHIALTAPDGTEPWLVHYAVDQDRAHRVEQFFTKIASRTTKGWDNSENLQNSDLTRREKQLLELLAEDNSLHEIAAKLHLSYATVRNHVQNILIKLDSHSILEAVACYLLGDEGIGNRRSTNVE